MSSLGNGMDVESESDPLMSAIFPPDSRVLFCTTNSGALWQYNVASGESGLVIAHGDNPVDFLVVSPDGLRIARWIVVTVSDEKSVRLWDPDSGILNRALEGHTLSVACLSLSTSLELSTAFTWRPDMLEFSIGDANGSFQVWRLVETSVPSVAWSTQLVLSAGNPVLAASDALYADVVGLSSVNQQLLTQFGDGAINNVLF
ncbi:hypothetical protein K457DRAFT_20878 [Linnemannia elongata AG-77]|uniref:Uncharacterized protein n=1 Tax=Linnemannia elongata AG-77 TaxID=1314771 RepID=A0A197JRG8_9FUNG|nr:hypothetical protein K457DRAFT_20878 [Linnemannia elongata AG-77]